MQSTLEKLASEGHLIAEKALGWRHFAKLKSTYTDALLQTVNLKTGRVHTSFSMVGAISGRLASIHPNLQNIPVRSAEGREIRRAFITEPGYRLISIDYSQIELRLVAYIANDQTMITAV